MKKIYFLLLAFSLFATANAQIVNIPDANFKAKLLAANTTNSIAKNLSGANFKIDTNSDGEIQESEAMLVFKLFINSSSISSLVGIEKFTNLIVMECAYNQLPSLNVTGLTNLQTLSCRANKLTNLNVSGLISLKTLSCAGNYLPSIDLTSLTNLESLNCNGNKLKTINVSGLVNLKSLSCASNELTALNLIGLSNLQTLDCSSNQFTSLDEATLTNLQTLNCSANQIDRLNVGSLKNLEGLICASNLISTLDVGNLTNLKYLSCSGNQLTYLDVSILVNLQQLECSENRISTLDVSSLVDLRYLQCSSNRISILDVSKLIKLYTLECGNNQISTLDITNLSELQTLGCQNNLIQTLNISSKNFFGEFLCHNNKLETVFIKNGVVNERFYFKDNPTLKYICCDESEIYYFDYYINDYGYTNCVVNSYCSFIPGGTFYTIQGNQKLDANNNSCDANDFTIPNLKYTITNGTEIGSVISDTSGNYSIPVQAGTHTITPKLENPSYFNVSPTSVNVTFPTQTSPFTQNFCITANGVRPDLEVTLLPLAPARPGFDAKYKLVYKNKGNTIQSGSVNLSFNDAVLDLVVANPVTTSQTANNLTWNFTALQPFETREISFTMNVNSPQETPAVINGAILAYTTTVTSAVVDQTSTDNAFTFNQTVVGSYDPNDKTCLEGSVITPALIGQYVHYTIRFENTGTFAAENVVVKDMIDLTKFDISTLVPTSASHSFVTNITAGNKVEFIFENINLPFDDANNDGYIAFKIKTKPTLVVNDSFTNEANIYFDYNFPILTNKAISTFKTLGTLDFDFTSYFTLYPNPVKTELNITAKETINVQSISVYNTLGQLVLVVTNVNKTANIDVSSLKTGNYFIQIKTDKGSSSSQFVKE